MAKKHRRKRFHKQPIPRAKAAPTTKNQKLTTAAIAVLSAYLGWSPIVPAIYLMVHVREIDTVTQNLMAICFLLYGLITAGKPQLKEKIRNLETDAFTDQKAHLKIRRYLVALLAVSFFSNAAMLIPVLYMRGYIAAFVTKLPSREQMGNKTFLLVSFVAGAVVSGILGNLSYDFIKFVAKKISERKVN